MASISLRGLQTVEFVPASQFISLSNNTDDNTNHISYTQGAYNDNNTSQTNIVFFLIPAALMIGLIILICKYKKQIQAYCVDPPSGPPPRVPSANYLNGNWTVIQTLPKRSTGTTIDNKDATSVDGDDEACSICFNDFFPKTHSIDTHDITASHHDHLSHPSLTDDYSISIHSLDIDTEHSTPTTDPTTDPTSMIEKKEEETVVQLPCQHIFHHSCIATWTEHHNNCPVCRFKPTKNPTEAPEVITMTEDRAMPTSTAPLQPPLPVRAAPAEASVSHNMSSSDNECGSDKCSNNECSSDDSSCDRFSVNTYEAPEFTSCDRVLHTYTCKNIAYN